jgi:hypothetical protein
MAFCTSQATELVENILRDTAADEYANLAEMLTEHAMKSGCDYADDFEFRLDLILDGLMRLRG